MSRSSRAQGASADVAAFAHALDLAGSISACLPLLRSDPVPGVGAVRRGYDLAAAATFVMPMRATFSRSVPGIG